MRVVIIRIHGISIMVGCGLLEPVMIGKLIFQNFFGTEKDDSERFARWTDKDNKHMEKRLKYRLVSCSGKMFRQ